MRTDPSNVTCSESDTLARRERAPRPRGFRRLWITSIVLLAGCAGEGASRAADSPSAAAELLYDHLLEDRITGAPDAGQLTELAPFLSDTLRALLAGAARLREEDARRFPDEKPAFAEGDLFSSLFEGPSTFRVVGPESDALPGRVRVEFSDDRVDPVTTWMDVVVAIQERGRWVVDDVEYGGLWDFAARGTLREGVEQALRESAESPR